MRHTPDLGMMRKTVESADGKGGSMGDSVGRREPGHSSHHKGLRIGIGVTLGFGFAALASLPVLAEVARLTSIPLGRGSATITLTVKSGIAPTVNSIRGTAGGLRVLGTAKVPKASGLGGAVSSAQQSFPIANVQGTIDGAPFTLNITLTLTLPPSQGPPKSASVGHVTGSFRNEPVRADLTYNSSNFDFKGTIGALHVTGAIEGVVHHGNKATAHATFDVTK